MFLLNTATKFLEEKKQILPLWTRTAIHYYVFSIVVESYTTVPLPSPPGEMKASLLERKISCLHVLFFVFVFGLPRTEMGLKLLTSK